MISGAYLKYPLQVMDAILDFRFQKHFTAFWCAWDSTSTFLLETSESIKILNCVLYMIIGSH